MNYLAIAQTGLALLQNFVPKLTSNETVEKAIDFIGSFIPTDDVLDVGAEYVSQVAPIIKQMIATVTGAAPAETDAELLARLRGQAARVDAIVDASVSAAEAEDAAHAAETDKPVE